MFVIFFQLAPHESEIEGSHTILQWCGMNRKLIWGTSVALLLSCFSLIVVSVVPFERPIAPTVPILVSNPYLIEITGRNYQWRVRSPGADGVFNTADDLHSARDIYVPLDTTIILQLKSDDFVYLLSLPALGAKEIAVPGLDFKLTVRAENVGEFVLDTDQLCGIEHPEMKGRFVVESRDVFRDRVRKESAARIAKLASQSERR